MLNGRLNNWFKLILLLSFNYLYPTMSKWMKEKNPLKNWNKSFIQIKSMIYTFLMLLYSCFICTPKLYVYSVNTYKKLWMHAVGSVYYAVIDVVWVSKMFAVGKEKMTFGCVTDMLSIFVYNLMIYLWWVKHFHTGMFKEEDILSILQCRFIHKFQMWQMCHLIFFSCSM